MGKQPYLELSNEKFESNSHILETVQMGYIAVVSK